MPDATNDTVKGGKRHFVAWSLAGLAFGLALAGAAWWFVGGKVWTDGRELRVPASRDDPREVLWTAPKPLEAEFNTADQEYEPSVSPDGTELYFVRGKAARNADVYISRRQNNRWTAPAPLEGVNSDHDDLGPRLSADGRFLLFYSDRPGGVGQYDVWAAPRLEAGGFGEPFNLGPAVNSEFNEFNPAPTPDGKRLVFATNRKAASKEQKEAWRATIRQSAVGDYDLFVAEVHTPSPLAGEGGGEGDAQGVGTGLVSEDPRTSATQPPELPPHPSPLPRKGEGAGPLAYQPALEIPGVNTEYHEGASCISPAGDFLYFASNRPGGHGRFDLYRSRLLADRLAGTFKVGPPENVGPSVNTPDNEADPQLALGGFHLLFSSDRPQPHGGEGYDLFAADSREVFPERLSPPLPTLGWSWWVLIASLLLLVPLLRFFRGWNDHRLNILQKCLLVSVLLHVLFTLGLSFVAVTHEVIAFAKQEMGMGEVAVGADGNRDVEIGLAIRGGGGGGSLPVSTEAPPTIEQRATLAAAPDAAIERPETIDAGVPQARAMAPGTSMIVQAVTPRPVPANTSDRVTVATNAEQSASPDVAVAMQPPVSEAERVVRPAAADLVAAKVAVPGATGASPQPLRIAAGPAKADGAAANSGMDLPASKPRPGVFSPEAFQPGKTAVIYADVLSDVNVALAATARVSPASPEAPLAVASGTDGLGAGGPTRVEPRDNPDGPAGVEVKLPAVAASGRSLLHGRPALSGDGTGNEATGGPIRNRIAAAAPGGPPVAVAGSDLIPSPGDIAVGIPAPAGGVKAVAKPAATLATTEVELPATRAAIPGGGGGTPVAGGGVVKVQPLIATASPAGAGGGSGIGVPGLPTTRPAIAHATGPVGLAGVQPAAEIAAAAGAPTVGSLPPGAARRAAVAAADTGAGPAAGPEGAASPQKQDTAALAGGGGVGRPGAALLGAGGGHVGPNRAGATGTLASAAAVGPRTFLAADKAGVPGAGVTPSAIGAPQVSLARPPGAGGTVKSVLGGKGGEADALSSAAEAVVASERIRPGVGDATGPGAGVSSGSLAVGPVGPAKYVPGPLGSGGGAVVTKPRTGDVAAPPLNLEVAITAPQLGAPEVMAQRAPENRKPLIEKMGGTKQSEEAVERALAYLARQQEPDGRWTYVDRRSEPGERQAGHHDMALTGLATLAFLAADHTPAKDGPYRQVVTDGVAFLVANQRSNGDLRGPRPGGGADMGNLYDHGIATLALSEAALMTGDAKVTAAAIRGAEFIVRSQDRNSGGWRYVPGEYGDTSVFGWQIMALHSAGQLGFELPKRTRDRALHYVELASQGTHRTLAGYQPGHGASHPMTAELLFARILLGQSLTAEGEKEATDYLTRRLPDARRADFYGWYYASLSLMQLQNDGWKKWNERTRETLVKMQKRGGADDGCWDGNILWGDRGGRIFSTALGALTLEVYYRYLPMSADRLNAASRPRTPPEAVHERPDIGYLSR